jgi:hypothetical protein
MTAPILARPIAKLYKRCARNRHDTCPGAFETWSVCSCPCHAGVSDQRPAPAVTCEDKHAAVVEAVAIVKRTPKAKASGLSTKTDKYAKWANAIVAKNARIEAAWCEVKAAKGLVIPAGMGVPQSVFASSKPRRVAKELVTA